jgi:hypothetical protein
MNLIFRRWRLGGTSARGIKAQMLQPVAIIRNDGIRPDGHMVSYVTKERFNEPVEYAFRWGCTSSIRATHTLNTVQSLEWCSNKKQGRIDMQAAGVSVPETWPAESFGHMSGNELYVLRPAMHAQGRHLVSGNPSVIQIAIRSNERYRTGYISRLINKVAEYRVAVIQNRVAWVAKKTPGNPNDVAWNVARGGSFANVAWDNWPMAAVKECLKAAKVSGTDFCGVDVMVDADGKAFVLEVNSAPSQTSPYRQGCFAKCFDHIIANGKEHFPDPAVDRIKTYKSVIHPAVREAKSERA